MMATAQLIALWIDRGVFATASSSAFSELSGTGDQFLCAENYFAW
jgi:hypothetical protein